MPFSPVKFSGQIERDFAFFNLEPAFEEAEKNGFNSYLDLIKDKDYYRKMIEYFNNEEVNPINGYINESFLLMALCGAVALHFTVKGMKAIRKHAGNFWGWALGEKNLQTTAAESLDDRQNITIGAKIKDCKVLGTPYLAVLGDKQEGDTIELENMKTGETKIVAIDEIIKILK